MTMTLAGQAGTLSDRRSHHTVTENARIRFSNSFGPTKDAQSFTQSSRKKCGERQVFVFSGHWSLGEYGVVR